MFLRPYVCGRMPGFELSICPNLSRGNTNIVCIYSSKAMQLFLFKYYYINLLPRGASRLFDSILGQLPKKN